MIIPRSLEGTAEALPRLSEADGKNYYGFAERMAGFLAESRKGFFISLVNGFGDLLRVFARTPALLKYR